MGLVAEVTAHDGYERNELQLVAGGLMTIGIFATGILVGRLISSGRGVSALIPTLAATLILFAIWLYGFSAWCSGCGAP